MVQGSIGIGFNIISVPILALVDPVLAPVPQLVVSLPLSISTMTRERAEIDFGGAGWVLAGRIPGALLGLALLAVASPTALDLLLAAFVLGAVAVLATGWQVRRSPPIDFTAGVAAGTTGLVASMGGPPLALLFARERGPTLRATLGMIFTVGVTVSLITRTIGGEITRVGVQIGALLVLPSLVGFMVSTALLSRVEGAVVRKGVFVLSSLAAVGLIGRAVFGG